MPLIVKDPRGRADRGTRAAAHAAHLERGHRAAAADDRHRLERLAAASPTTPRSPIALDLAAILADPAAPRARPYVLHATDEIVTEFAVEPYAADAPLHVMAIRTPRAKYATYSHWRHRQRSTPSPAVQEAELYDYSQRTRAASSSRTAPGTARSRPRCAQQLERAIDERAARAAPRALRAAQRRGFADYFSTAKRAAQGAAAMRKLPQRTRRRAPASRRHRRRPAQLRPLGLGGRPRRRSPRRRRRAPGPRHRGRRTAPRSCVSKPVRGRVADRRERARRSAPASTLQEATAVAPFQLAATLTPPARPRAPPRATARARGLAAPRREHRREALHARPERAVEQHAAGRVELGEVRQPP